MLATQLFFCRKIEVANQRAYEYLTRWDFTKEKPDPDFLILQRREDKKSIGIDEAKKVAQFLAEKPYTKKNKAVLIESAHLLTTEAQNALLKVLEEPPRYAIIILTASDLDLLLPTVKSRCAIVNYVDDAGLSKAMPQSLWELAMPEKLLLAEKLSKLTKLQVQEELEGYIKADLADLESRSILDPSYAFRVSVLERLLEVYDDLKRYNVAVRFALEYVFLLHNAMI